MTGQIKLLKIHTQRDTNRSISGFHLGLEALAAFGCMEGVGPNRLKNTQDGVLHVFGRLIHQS